MTLKIAGLTVLANSAGIQLSARLTTVDTRTTDVIQPIQPEGGRIDLEERQAWPSPPSTVLEAMSRAEGSDGLSKVL